MGANTYRIDISPNMVCDERLSAAVIPPGALVVLGSANTLTLRGAGAAAGPLRVAITAPSRGIGVNETYASGVTTPYSMPASGSKVAGILADGETISIGDLLYPAASGQLSATPALGTPILQAEEAITTSGATALIECRATGLSEASAT